MYVGQSYTSLFRATFIFYVAGATAYSTGWNCESKNDGVYECRNGINCIPNEWVCNGLDNCPDGSDEDICGGGFTCRSNDRWIPDSLVCNGYANCEDSSDEQGCDCPEYTCTLGACYSSAQRCDKINDCGDWSDESVTCSCPIIEFTCTSGYTNFAEKCIPAEWVCDGYSDCPDGSDEYSSRCSSSCAAGYTRCDRGVSNFQFSRCISDGYLCDNDADCVDHSDETSCFGCSKRCLSSTQTFHGYLLKYICADFKQCDYTKDCLDGSDENAVQCTCFSGTLCEVTGVCVPFSARCDGENYCGDSKDWTDECFCGDYGDYQTQYCSNTGRCLAPWQLCDGVDDCGDNSDESFCPYAVTDCEYFSESKYPCATFAGRDDRCIDIALVCNGNNDCSDGSDETICNEPCSSGEIRCATGTSTLPGKPICIPSYLWCDGTAHCHDHSDENYLMCQGGCSQEYDIERWWCQSATFNDTYFCITFNNYCNGLVECAGQEDENSCCSAQQYTCLNELDCIPSSWVCDDWHDCDGDDDEANCDWCDTTIDYLCNTGKCIPHLQYCDGRNDCGDSSDEPQNCKPYNNCPSSEFRCASSDCIPSESACDGLWDCPDGSDEVDCGSTTDPTVIRDTNIWLIVGPVLGGVVVVIAIVAVLIYKFMDKSYQTARPRPRNAVGYNPRQGARVHTISGTPAVNGNHGSTFPQSSVQNQPQRYPNSSTQFQTPSQHHPGVGYPPQAHQNPGQGYQQMAGRNGSSAQQTAKTQIADGTPTSIFTTGVHPSQQLQPSAPAQSVADGTPEPPPNYESLFEQGGPAPQPVFPAQVQQARGLPPFQANGPSGSHVGAFTMPPIEQ